MNRLSLHASDLCQSGGRGNHIRDRKFDLDDLRFFQESLCDETEFPCSDVWSIPPLFPSERSSYKVNVVLNSKDRHKFDYTIADSTTLVNPLPL